MLQRQQASAIIAARTRIVEGAVSMVEMALNELSKRSVVDLDPERSAAMVSNLLVVLRDALRKAGRLPKKELEVGDSGSLAKRGRPKGTGQIKLT